MKKNKEVFTGLNLQFVPAPLLKRILACLIDGAIVGLMYYLLYIVLIILGVFSAAILSIVFKGQSNAENLLLYLKNIYQTFNGTFGEAFGGLIIALLVLVIIFLLLLPSHLYYVYQEFKKGQTIGKKIMGLSVISLKQGPLSWSQCILREFLRYVDLFLYLPGLISILLSDKNQRIGDRAASTLVVYRAAEEEKRNYMYLSQGDYLRAEDLIKISDLIPQELWKKMNQEAYSIFIRKDYSDKTNEKNHVLQLVEEAREFIESTQKVEDYSLLRFLAESYQQKVLKKKEGHNEK